ncbi:MAG: hypothetical protein NUV98_06205 [Candidatus Roizmanbacteria bacterium]|nr:hypothetical protein [Candidatus Roizmanbacteria bacterium]
MEQEGRVNQSEQITDQLPQLESGLPYRILGQTKDGYVKIEICTPDGQRDPLFRRHLKFTPSELGL